MTQLALITGASGGIGQAVAMQLAQQDIHCVLVSRDAEKLHKLHSTLTNSHILEADVTDAQSTQQLWQQVLPRMAYRIYWCIVWAILILEHYTKPL